MKNKEIAERLKNLIGELQELYLEITLDEKQRREEIASRLKVVNGSNARGGQVNVIKFLPQA